MIVKKELNKANICKTMDQYMASSFFFSFSSIILQFMTLQYSKGFVKILNQYNYSICKVQDSNDRNSNKSKNYEIYPLRKLEPIRS